MTWTTDKNLQLTEGNSGFERSLLIHFAPLLLISVLLFSTTLDFTVPFLLGLLFPPPTLSLDSCRHDLLHAVSRPSNVCYMDEDKFISKCQGIF